MYRYRYDSAGAMGSSIKYVRIKSAKIIISPLLSALDTTPPIPDASATTVAMEFVLAVF